MSGMQFAQKFILAIEISQKPYRAVTHNKGIMNGIDAGRSTGNDFRAVEAGVHAFAARNGIYSVLTMYFGGDDFVSNSNYPFRLGL